jgi:hypothetical protein
MYHGSLRVDLGSVFILFLFCLRREAAWMWAGQLAGSSPFAMVQCYAGLAVDGLFVEPARQMTCTPRHLQVLCVNGGEPLGGRGEARQAGRTSR